LGVVDPENCKGAKKEKKKPPPLKRYKNREAMGPSILTKGGRTGYGKKKPSIRQ